MVSIGCGSIGYGTVWVMVQSGLWRVWVVAVCVMVESGLRYSLGCGESGLRYCLGLGKSGLKTVWVVAVWVTASLGCVLVPFDGI